MLFNDVFHEYQQVQSSHDNDEREDEILSDDAMNIYTNFVETRDTETMQDIIRELFITDAEKAEPVVRADDNSSPSNASSVAAQDEMKREKAEA